MDNCHILLVEDNEGDILLTTETIEQAGLQPKLTVLKDGKEAIEYMGKQGKYACADLPDLILLDINLPRKNGHEVLQFLKGKEILKDIPVVMLTTSSSEMDKRLCRENRANTYITKPLEVSAFIQTVDELLKTSMLWVGNRKLFY